MQRLSASCILYLQTVHSSRSTTFLVVLAYPPISRPSTIRIPHTQQAARDDAPSCGRRAWSDHRNPTAYGRNDASPAQPTNPCPSCIGSPCEACTTTDRHWHGRDAVKCAAENDVRVLLARLALAVCRSPVKTSPSYAYPYMRTHRSGESYAQGQTVNMQTCAEALHRPTWGC